MEARAIILSMVDEYSHAYHSLEKAFRADKQIPYAAKVYDGEEIRNLVDSALEFWLTAGNYAVEFEKQLAYFLGVKHCAMVNSGSSANLIAFMALTSPLLGDRAIIPGDEVITVAAGFPTTVGPIIQYGAVPVFLDITIPQYNLDIDMLEEALSPRTKAVMAAHTLGNPFDLAKVRTFCDNHNLWLIEDNCDALGSKLTIGTQDILTGTVGDIGTSSFYPPHHITTGEGGAVYTNNSLLNKIIVSLRDWGRDCVCAPGQDNSCKQRFNNQYGKLPLGYDHKYVYSHFGYNLKATDMQAAIGCAQLKKLPSFVKRRRRNFCYLHSNLKDLADKLILPESLPGSSPSWFGFMLTCRDGVSRNEAVSFIEKNGVQTRMLFAGNLTLHPCFSTMRASGRGHRTIGKLINTNKVTSDTFWIGVYPGLTDSMLDFMADVIHRAFA